MKKLGFGLSSYLILASVNSWAGIDGYDCEVKAAYGLSSKAELEGQSWSDIFEKAKFSVDRKSGEIAGKVLPTFLSTSTKVVNFGSTENSFKAISIFEDQVQVIEIQEFRETHIKPFMALSMGGAGIVTGICK